MNDDYTYPRETVEYVLFREITAHGLPAVNPEYSLTSTEPEDRPVFWAPLTDVNGKWGFLIADLEPQDYKVWARIPASPENSVIEVGRIEVT